jgi:hypothetical protein
LSGAANHLFNESFGPGHTRAPDPHGIPPPSIRRDEMSDGPSTYGHRGQVAADGAGGNADRSGQVGACGLFGFTLLMVCLFIAYRFAADD